MEMDWDITEGAEEEVQDSVGGGAVETRLDLTLLFSAATSAGRLFPGGGARGTAKEWSMPVSGSTTTTSGVGREVATASADVTVAAGATRVAGGGGASGKSS